MALNLGDITFNLGANTEGLNRALQDMSRFSNETNRVARSVADGAEQQARAMSRQEHAMRDALQKLLDFAHATERVGGSTARVQELERVFTHFAQSMSQGVMAAQNFTRANDLMAASMARGRRALQEETDAMREAANASRLAARAGVMDLNAQSTVRTFTASANRAGAPSAISQGVVDALRQYQAALGASDATLESMSQAQAEFNAALATGRIQLANYTQAQRNAAQAGMQYAQTEKMIAQATERVLNLNAQIERSKGPGELLIANNAALRQYIADLNIAAGNATLLTAAQNRLNATLGASRRAFADFRGTSEGTVKILRDLQAASVLAVGPLSGIAARISALAALTDRSTWKIAGFVGGVTALGYALFKLGGAAVDTERQMQSILNTMAAGSGSLTLAKKDFEFLENQSERLGLNLMDTAKEYAAFSAAAAQTNVAGREARTLFVGLTEAMTAMHRPSEDVSRALLALQQMLSKGKVQSQELVLQLGNALPGALALAARSLGKTTAELQKMMEQGQLAPETLIKALGPFLQQQFGDAASRSADSLIGAQNRLSNAVTEFNRVLNDSVQASAIYKGALQALTTMIKYVTQNMETIIPIAGAVAVGLVAAFASPYLITGIRALVSGLMMVRDALLMVAAGEALATGGLSALITLGVTAAAAGGSFLLLKEAMKGAGNEMDMFNQELDAYIKMAKAAGSASKGQTQEYIDEATRRLGALAMQKEALEQLQATAAETNKTFSRAAPGSANMGTAAEQAKRYADGITNINKQMDELKGKITVLQGIPALDNKPIDKAVKSTDNLIDRIKTLQVALEQNKNVIANLNGATVNQIEQAHAVAEAYAMTTKLARQGKEEIVKVGEALGITGMSSQTAAEGLSMVRDHLAALITSGKLTENQIQKLEAAIKRTPEALDDFSHSIEQLKLETEALEGGPIAFRDWEHSIKNANNELYKLKETLSKTTLTQEQQDQMLAQFDALSKAHTKARIEFDDTKKWIEGFANTVTGAFSGVGEGLAKLAITGEQNFKSLKDAAVDFTGALIQMIFQLMILDPIAKGIQENAGGFLKGIGGFFKGLFAGPDPGSNSWGTPGGTQPRVTPHKGAAFVNGNVLPMARGDILTRPTYMPMASGGLALAAERGQSEAVIPLARTSNGDLGVQMAGGKGGGDSTIDIRLWMNGQDTGQRKKVQRGGNAPMDVQLDKMTAANIRGQGETFRAINDMFNVAPKLSGAM